MNNVKVANAATAHMIMAMLSAASSEVAYVIRVMATE
jgi:hypothetical protein